MTCPAWMLWVTTRHDMPWRLQDLMDGCVLEVGQAIGVRHFMLDAKRYPAIARKIRLVMPGELLEALLAEAP